MEEIIKKKKAKIIVTTGSRKRAVARAVTREGSGKVRINSISISKEINSENLVENKVTGLVTLGKGEHSRIYNNLNSEVQGYLKAVLKGKRSDGI